MTPPMPDVKQMIDIVLPVVQTMPALADYTQLRCNKLARFGDDCNSFDLQLYPHSRLFVLRVVPSGS